MDTLIQILVNGLTVGSTYALIAVGLSLVWATLRSINFAHGELYMLGAYASLGIGVVAAGAGGSWNPFLVLALVFLVSAAVGALVSVTIERTIFRPLRDAPEAVPILATIGVGIVLQNVIFLRFGSAFNSYPLALPRGGFAVAGVGLNAMQLAMVAGTVAIVLGLNFFLGRTRVGTAMRAVSWDRETVKLMGANADNLILLAFAIGGALAGMAGAFVSFYYGVTTFFMGFIAVVKGFTAAVFGGFGNITGALLGGLLLGIFEAVAAGYVSGQWRDVIAFVLLLAIILTRPTGIMGERLPARV